MDYAQYIRENFTQGTFLPEARIQSFLENAREAAAQETQRLQDAILRQPWLADFYQPRDDVRFQIDHMLRITGSQAISLTSEQGMFEKSRQMLLLEPPGTGSDDTARGTLYEPWILKQADQMINPHGKLTPLPNVIAEMGKPVNGLSAAPDNLYWANDHFLIVDAKCPREAHTSPPEAYVAQLHFYEAALRDYMRKQYPEWADAPVDKVLAQGDVLRGRVYFLKIHTVPGMSEQLWQNAQVLYRHVCQTQNLWPEPPRPVFDPNKMSEVKKLTQSLLEIKDQEESLTAQKESLRTELLELLGNDPKAWPQLAKEAQFRPSWPRTADDRLLNALRENAIIPPEKPVYDVDGLVEAVKSAGIPVEPFIKDREINVSASVKALEMLKIQRCDFQTPSFSLTDKRPPKEENVIQMRMKP